MPFSLAIPGGGVWGRVQGVHQSRQRLYFHGHKVHQKEGLAEQGLVGGQQIAEPLGGHEVPSSLTPEELHLSAGFSVENDREKGEGVGEGGDRQRKRQVNTHVN